MAFHESNGVTASDPLPLAGYCISVLAVIVVYERDLADVAPWPTARHLLEDAAPEDGPQLCHVLIYDNSASSRAVPPSSTARCTYVSNPHNGGTAAAYSAAAQLALDLRIPWLLLLDHDTHLPLNFLRSAAIAFRTAGEQRDVAALLPAVRHRDGTLISPVRVTRLGTFRPLELGKRPRPGQHVSAIASGAILRVSLLRDVLPLPAELWLDYVDHWIFAQFHRRGLSAIVTSQVVQHDLSIMSLAGMSPARLNSVLQGEARFHGLLSPTARLVYPLRLAFRVLRIACVNRRLAATALRSISQKNPHLL